MTRNRPTVKPKEGQAYYCCDECHEIWIDDQSICPLCGAEADPDKRPTPASHRRFEVGIRIGADSVEAICAALRAMEFMYASEGAGHSSTSGGSDSGWVCVDSEDPSQTHDRYFEEVDRWLNEKRAEKEAKEKTV